MKASRSTPTLIAHRGFAKAYPENTVFAAKRTRLHGFVSMVEVDVMPTADGTVVCFHDDDLHRTERSRGITDARGTVWETESETVLDATVLDSGETIPRLAAVLAALPEDVGINVELKNPGSSKSVFGRALGPDERKRERRLWMPFVETVSELLDGFDGEILVSSFYEGAIAAMRATAPTVPLGVLISDSLDDGIEIARRYDVSAVHPPWNLVSGTPFAGEPGYLDYEPELPFDIVEAAHDDGRVVNVWSIDSWYRADQLARAGVDGLIADQPHVIDVLRKSNANDER